MNLLKSSWKKLILQVLVIVCTSGLLISSAQAATLQFGDSGPEVVRLQEQLQSLGYDVGAIDGNFGSRTEAAVKAAQIERGLKADGIVGELTWNALRLSDTSVSQGDHGSSAVRRIVATAMAQQGVPYVWGGTTPCGFDCSGFTQYVFAVNGISLPRTADVQFSVGVPVARNHLQPGDLIFFSTYEPGPSHSGIYLGDGVFIHASSSRGVSLAYLDSSYWASRYLGARRVVK
ncbi:C40 family peptidase [Sporomusa acidovorans]|uniref:NlpC/P60 domain-containing protein n=1 Tax=Sporomusa acidovorans (strain ATCC 49682 / DSM 3132 / Mol) TaxID=1123286 RepID=A0ABZ3JBF8_SPOA4|nr:NlpC/P60 family protein [Sporomusa acidovorans]OZC18607.1 peptidoglycan endopeptidase LytF precursor [Sporomusa acidovorans DSM 3132]SDF51984.1 Cell wall-associated hydrolase, NlpC family [Sporomusa acidovorans]